MRYKAIKFEKQGLCTTYLILNEDLLIKNAKTITKDCFFVEGYFSLVHKSIEFYSDISKSKRKKIFCGLDKGKNGFSTVLVAQLGKFIDGDSLSTIRIDDIMKHALDIIIKARELIVFKTILVECRDNAKLTSMYERYEFKEFQHTEDGEHPIQMIRYLH